MARSISAQSQDNLDRRQAARNTTRLASGAEYTTTGPRDATTINGYDTGRYRTLVGGTATADQQDAAAAAATRPLADPSGSGTEHTGVDARAPVEKTIRFDPTTTGAGRDATGDVNAATKLRDELLNERNNLPQRSAPYVAESGNVTGAHIDAAPTIGNTQVRATPQITATAVQAPSISPIERVQAGTVAATPGAVAAKVNSDPQAQARARTLSLLNSIEGTAAGTGPTAADAQMQKATDQAIATQQSLVAGQHGTGMVTAGLRAASNIADIQQKAATDSAILKVQEQTKARDQLLSGYEGTRGQDINLASTDAGFAQAANLKNADIGAVRALKDADLKAAADMGNANAQNEMNRRQAELTLTADTTNAGNALDAAKSNQNVTATANLEDARLTQDTNKTNQDAELKVRMANAGFDQAAILQSSAQELQRNLANAGFDLTQEQVDDLRQKTATDQALASTGQLLNYDTNQQQVEMQRQQLQQQYEAAKRAGDEQLAGGILGSLAALGTGALAFLAHSAPAVAAAAPAASDRRMKTDIRPLYSDEGGKKDRKALLDHYEGGGKDDDPIGDLLDQLHPAAFKYKNPDDEGAAPGQRYGVMAQDLEKSPVGRSIVIEMGNGRKGIDSAQAVGVLLASMAKMRRDVKRVEGRR
jgi:hypothetical protein